MNALLTLFALPSTHVQMEPQQPRPCPSPENPPLGSSRSCKFHPPPPHVHFDENPSVFGSILRGELPSLTLRETQTLLAFEDRSPRAPLHALVIPKRHIKSVFNLNADDLYLLQDMHHMAVDLIHSYYPEAAKRHDYILCYHIPPFSSVPHLHLHVLAPASEMNWIYRYGKYLVGSRWCAGELDVRQRLQEGKPAVPYKFWGC